MAESVETTQNKRSSEAADRAALYVRLLGLLLAATGISSVARAVLSVIIAIDWHAAPGAIEGRLGPLVAAMRSITLGGVGEWLLHYGIWTVPFTVGVYLFFDGRPVRVLVRRELARE